MDSLVVVQQLRQLGQPGIHRLFAAAALAVQIGTAAGTKSLAVLRAEKFRVHIEDKGVPRQFRHIHLIIVQQHDVVVLIGLTLLGQHAGVVRGFSRSNSCAQRSQMQWSVVVI